MALEILYKFYSRWFRGIEHRNSVGNYPLHVIFGENVENLNPLKPLSKISSFFLQPISIRPFLQNLYILYQSSVLATVVQ